ncbi:hypothetical protein SLS62_001695 [Diatrype stigma]|uniref:Uncharacterized protein n=1 Tax=Diatrype stigma TaxID=117547 RepID=A0AAN9YW06_9PEZI
MAMHYMEKIEHWFRQLEAEAAKTGENKTTHAPLTSFHPFPKLPPEVKHMIWQKHKEATCKPLRHYIGVHLSIQTYGALDVDTGLFVQNVSTASTSAAVDPRALRSSGTTIIGPREYAQLTGLIFTPTPGQAAAEINIWKTGQLKPVSSRLRYSETWFWADFRQDVVFLGNDYIWEAYERLCADELEAVKLEAVHSFAVLASTAFRRSHYEPFTPPDVSWTHQIQKLALRKDSVLFGRPMCLTRNDEKALVNMKALRVLYIIVASNPDCKHGRPYTWGGGVSDDFVANDGFMPVEAFQKRHPAKKDNDCACAIDAADDQKYQYYKAEVEKFFQGLEVPRKVEVKLVVDPYGG